MLKFESLTVNFYSSTKTSQVQGSQNDHYVKKLRNIVEKGTKAQYTLIESTSNSGSAEITDPVLNLKPTSDHDDRYEKFQAFIKEQRDFNKKIERHISSNSIEISGCTIQLKDLECKCKNQTKVVKLFCENHIQAVKNEIREEVQKLAVTKSGTGTWDLGLGTWGLGDSRTRGRGDVSDFFTQLQKLRS